MHERGHKAADATQSSTSASTACGVDVQDGAQAHGAGLVLVVRAGAKFSDGVRVERDANADATRSTVAKSKMRTKLVQDKKLAA